MTKSIEQQAADAAQGVLNNLLTVRNAGQTAAGAIAADLSRAGRLVTERDVLCREYADAHLAYLQDSRECHRFDAAGDALRAYDREHAPKPRYCIFCDSVYDTTIGYVVSSAVVYQSPDREKREAVAAALNALAEKEAGR